VELEKSWRSKRWDGLLLHILAAYVVVVVGVGLRDRNAGEVKAPR